MHIERDFMYNLDDLIYSLLSKNISCSYLDVSGDGKHFEVIIVSDEFINKSRVDRHKIVYHALENKMHEEIHALSMKTFTKAEWESINGKTNN